MSKILWCIKSIFYGGKLAFVISGMLLIYSIYFSIAYKPNPSDFKDFIYPMGHHLTPSDSAKRIYRGSFENKEILNMKDFEDDQSNGDSDEHTQDEQAEGNAKLNTPFFPQSVIVISQCRINFYSIKSKNLQQYRCFTTLFSHTRRG
jgi:hypothetical protein